MTTQDALETLESALDRPNPRLHLYTLAERRGTRAVTTAPAAGADWLAAQAEIASVKAGR